VRDRLGLRRASIEIRTYVLEEHRESGSSLDGRLMSLEELHRGVPLISTPVRHRESRERERVFRLERDRSLEARAGAVPAMLAQTEEAFLEERLDDLEMRAALGRLHFAEVRDDETERRGERGHGGGVRA
jgi:hypothetical protein